MHQGYMPSLRRLDKGALCVKAAEKTKAGICYFRLNVLLSVELLSNERPSESHLAIKMPVGEVTGI